MEIKIGIQHAPRELVVESDVTAEELDSAVSSALADGGVLTLTDTKGRKVLVPGTKIAYLEVGSASQGTVGFR